MLDGGGLSDEQTNKQAYKELRAFYTNNKKNIYRKSNFIEKEKRVLGIINETSGYPKITGRSNNNTNVTNKSY